MLRWWSIAMLMQLVVAIVPGTPPSSESIRKPIWNDTSTDLLRRDLLTTYDKIARPSYPAVTEAKVGLTVNYIELDEATSVLSSHVFLRMSWEDPKMRWDPNAYGNITTLHMGEHEIWQPDILVYNSATGHSIDYYGSTHCLVQSNGTVLWVPPSRLLSFCTLDLRYWPYDEQHCEIKMGSWTYSGLEINLILDGLSIDLIGGNTDWLVTNSSESRNEILYNCCPEPYVDVTFKVTLQRRSDIYRSLIATPATVVILLSLLCFWLPVASSEKLLLNGVNAVVIVSFLLYFARRLPSMGMHTPYVVLFYSNALYMTCISIILSVVVLNIARNRQTRAVPWFVRNALDGWLGRVLLLHWLGVHAAHAANVVSPRTQELREHAGGHPEGAFEENHDEDQHIIRNHLGGGGGLGNGGGVGAGSEANGNCGNKYGLNQHYWLLLATAVDRVAFVGYACVYLVMATVYAV